MISVTDMLFRLILAAFLGSFIGLEREFSGRDAGFRTHLLVSVGSCLIMLISLEALKEASGSSYDPARIAAQVISGIGFLGAGTILQSKGRIKGLTTAATLWTTAAIGLACGAAYYKAAFFTVVIIMLALVVFRTINRRLFNTFQQILVVEFDKDSYKEILKMMGYNYKIIKEEYNKEKESTILDIECNLSVKSKHDLLKKLYNNKNVYNIIFKNIN